MANLEEPTSAKPTESVNVGESQPRPVNRKMVAEWNVFVLCRNAPLINNCHSPDIRLERFDAFSIDLRLLVLFSDRIGLVLDGDLLVDSGSASAHAHSSSALLNDHQIFFRK